jgi:lipid A 4'-phosphatase
MIRPTKSMWIAPLLAFLLFTPFSSWIDQTIARALFQQVPGTVARFQDSPLLDFLYSYPLLPGQVLFVGSALTLILSYCVPLLKWLRPHTLVLVLTLVIGGGLIINVLLKDQWGRPRPKQVEEFGGTKPFRPYYLPDFSKDRGKYKSFACGHCAMGFYFFAVALIGRRFRRRGVELSGWILSFTLGLSLGLTRILQGGHFFSDVFASLVIMWYTALFVDWIVYEEMGCEA